MHLRDNLAAMILAAAALLSSSAAAFAKIYYVAPLGAPVTCTATGTKECPYPSVGVALGSKKVVGGDTVLLMDGDHGGIQEKYWTFDSPVTIQSENGSNARISWISFGDSAKNIRLRNLKVWRDEGDDTTAYLIRAYSGSSYLTFENLDIRSRANAATYMDWSLARWVSVAAIGMDLRGQYFAVRNCTLTGVSGGIYMGPNALVENNVINGFTGDGMKGVSNSTFRGNVVKNVVNADPDYHNDGFQSYSSSGPVSNLMLENNTIIQWTNPASPLKGSLQGIGMFDGWYDHIVIRNNLIVTDHYNGISVYGARGAKILNNTVVDLSGLPNTSPWIMVNDKKDGSPSQNVLVANNLAMAFSMKADPALNIVLVNNSVILDPGQVFTDPKSFNYRPKAASGYLDSADTTSAPPTDILGAARPYGAGPDRGAYEVGATAAKGKSPGATAGTASAVTMAGSTEGAAPGAATGAATEAATGNAGAKFLTPPKK
jgi:hypothetical protein